VTVKKEIKGFFLIALDTAKEKSQQRKSLFFFSKYNIKSNKLRQIYTK